MSRIGKLPIHIPQGVTITLAEAPTQGQDIFHYAPKSAGAEDYEKVCNELLTELK